MNEGKVTKSNEAERAHEKSNQESKAVENDKVLKRDNETGWRKCKINQKNCSLIELCKTLVFWTEGRIRNSNV